LADEWVLADHETAESHSNGSGLLDRIDREHGQREALTLWRRLHRLATILNKNTRCVLGPAFENEIDRYVAPVVGVACRLVTVDRL